MNFNISTAVSLTGSRLEKTERFLERMGLIYEGGADYTVQLFDEDFELLGTGSLCGNILKYIAIDDSLRGEGGAAAIVSRLVQFAYQNGRRRLFLFTKPQNEAMFRSLGFFTLSSTDRAIYMENSRSGLSGYIDSLQRGYGIQGAVVANCNPFTLGHRYLMERAASMVDTLHVFVVSQDSSEFPFQIRFNLVKQGTAHIKNLILHESGDYIVSYLTFPTYFIKDRASAEEANAELDLTLFGTRIAPKLNITKRFVGTEPFCAVTRAYNAQMKRILPKYGIEIIEIERYNEISASKVRAALASGDYRAIADMVPETTMAYLLRNGDRNIQE